MASRTTSLGGWLGSMVRRPDPPTPDFASALVEHLADGVVACDADGHFVLLNRRVRDGAEDLTSVVLPLDVPLARWAEPSHPHPPGCPDLPPTEELPLVRSLRGEMVPAMTLETRSS